jgi:mRNA-degrading endonuclease RelE of RelBE toxin-antitoxin system
VRKIEWTERALEDMAALDKGIARRVKQGVERFAETGTGDVKRLEPPLTGFRLRCGDYRVFFDLKDESTVEITGVLNRRGKLTVELVRRARSSTSGKTEWRERRLSHRE